MIENKKKTERLALSILILLILLCVLGLWLFNRNADASFPDQARLNVVVEIKGQQIYSVPLSEDNELVASSDLGENIIEIKGGSVCVKEADCPNQICVHTVPITAPGRSIICLPHRMVVSIVDATLK
ncbi:MAG: NusG domain II-containing protein [Lachnospiraceae bacterium]|nr:NusG domain II-containing protein [Lachnospiraceae bacterium]